MILETDSEGPDQTARIRCPHMPEDTFPHGETQLIFWTIMYDNICTEPHIQTNKWLKKIISGNNTLGE